MAKGPQIELEPDGFREIPQKPLGKPRDLWTATVIALIAALVCAYAAVQWGTIWGALLIILPSAGFGIGLAGLYPWYFFGKAD